MKPSSPELVDEQACCEATEWLILLQETPDDADLQVRFRAWLAAAPQNAAAWAESSHTYNRIGDTTPAFAGHWESKKVVPLRPRRRRLVYGMTAALAACLLLALLPGALLRLQADYLTGTGELRRVNLPDGSTVRLGPDSALRLAFEDGERRIELLKGQAFFDVTRDPFRPFKVAAGPVETTVLGTAFEVRRQEGAIRVAVRHGLVQVDGSGKSRERLKAGDWLAIEAGKPIAQGTALPTQIATWTDRQLIARDQPVAEIVDELRPYFGGLIVLSSDGFKDRRVTGLYSLEDPVAALRVIARAHGARVRQISPWLVILSAD